MSEEILSEKHCVPCEGGAIPMSYEEANLHKSRLKQPWGIFDTGRKIRCEFNFKDFSETMFFVNKVANIATEENHHPDMHVSYNKVVIELSTHAIGGLSENDFILAAKIEKIFSL